jgi:hypothetical protein
MPQPGFRSRAMSRHTSQTQRRGLLEITTSPHQTLAEGGRIPYQDALAFPERPGEHEENYRRGELDRPRDIPDTSGLTEWGMGRRIISCWDVMRS